MKNKQINNLTFMKKRFMRACKLYAQNPNDKVYKKAVEVFGSWIALLNEKQTTKSS